jgi:predicted nucleic acid-binding protein
MSVWVVDTSALVAGLLAKRGAANRLVDAIFSGELRPAYTPPIVSEYAEVFARPELGIAPAERWAILLKLRSSGVLVRPVAFELKLPDEDDRPFMEAALATDEKVVVTLGLRVLSPREAAPLL